MIIFFIFLHFYKIANFKKLISNFSNYQKKENFKFYKNFKILLKYWEEPIDCT